VSSIYDISVTSIQGEVTNLRSYEGQVLLIVNVASQCGFTPQYAGLEVLHKAYGESGFAVLGFPCNQFGKQEPDGHEVISTFCETKFGVTFPMFEKVEVNGGNSHPLYAALKGEARGVLGTQAVKWNFTKFLVDRNGHPIKRYGSSTTPASLSADIEAALAQSTD
jgi:glutathione peroxidase